MAVNCFWGSQGCVRRRNSASNIAGLALLAVTITVGCGDDTSSASATTGASAGGGGSGGEGGTGGTGGDGGVGGEGPLVIGGDRPVQVFVPSSYDESVSMPLVILLHGYTASGNLQEAYMQVQPHAEQRGFIYAHPDGTTDLNDEQFWNASDACCDFAGTGVDDSGYLQGVIDDIKAAYNVDDKRVFLIGHSNGGFMSYRMACDHADSIAAIASLAGAMPLDPSGCMPSEGVAALQIHGTLDETIEYPGGVTLSAYPGAVETTESWATLMGCSLTPDESAPPLDLEANIDGDESTVAIYGDQCQSGGHAELWTIEGGSHVPALSADFMPNVLDFLFAHPKP